SRSAIAPTIPHMGEQLLQVSAQSSGANPRVQYRQGPCTPRARAGGQPRRVAYFFFGRSQPSTTACRERATVSRPAGASRVTTEPAAMVASLPIVTGATSELLEPMKAPSSMRVVDLFTPS